MGLISFAVGAPALLAGTGLIDADFSGSITPRWVVASAGFMFVCGGLSLMLSAASKHVDETGALTAQAPFGLRALQFLISLAVPAMFALVLSWIAFGEGERPFAVSLPFPGLLDQASAAIVGRILYGAVAIVMWWFFALGAARGWRKLFSSSAED